MTDQAWLKPSDETFSYLNKETGEIEVRNVTTGEIVGKKSLSPAWVFDQSTADVICQKIIEGGLITNICGVDGFPPYSVIRRWRKQNAEFDNLIKDAEQGRADFYMDKVAEISHQAMNGQIGKDDVASRRLAIEGFSKVAEAGAPGKYGRTKDQAKIQINVVIDTGVPDPMSGAKEVSVGVNKEVTHNVVVGEACVEESKGVLDVEGVVE